MNRVKILAVSVVGLSSLAYAAMGAHSPKSSDATSPPGSPTTTFGGLRQMRDDIDRMQTDPTYEPPTR